MSRLLEICCDSPEAARVAEENGAQRIELCARLDCGGLTPGNDLLERVLGHARVPVFTMVRPRPGDFVFSAGERGRMVTEIAEAKRRGVSGIVGGALAPGSMRIDLVTTTALVEAARPLPFTFHRAFDLVADPYRSLEDFAALGVARVLTSGGGARAIDALESLRRFQTQVAGRITIVACGGIRAGNLAAVASLGALVEFHSAATSPAHPDSVDPAEVAAMARILTEARDG